MKESYQREEYCSDQRKGSLRHFQPPKNLGSNFKAMLELLLRQNRGDECNRDISTVERVSFRNGDVPLLDSFRKVGLFFQSRSGTVVSSVMRVAEIVPMMCATRLPAVSYASRVKLPV